MGISARLEYLLEQALTKDGLGGIKISGSKVVECLDQDDADNNVLTFSDDIYALEIYHNKDTAQKFTVNGLTLTIPSGGWRSPIGGTPGKTVTIPASVDCIVTRLE